MVTDPDTLDVLDILTELITPAVFFDENLCALVICRVLNISLQGAPYVASCSDRPTGCAGSQGFSKPVEPSVAE